MRSLIALAVVGFAFYANMSLAAANGLPCLVGNPDETLGKLLASSGQQPVLRFEIETGADPWPAMIIGKPSGEFSIVVLMHGMTCLMAVGHGLVPAAKDAVFAPEKPS